MVGGGWWVVEMASGALVPTYCTDMRQPGQVCADGHLCMHMQREGDVGAEGGGGEESSAAAAAAADDDEMDRQWRHGRTKTCMYAGRTSRRRRIDVICYADAVLGGQVGTE